MNFKHKLKFYTSPQQMYFPQNTTQTRHLRMVKGESEHSKTYCRWHHVWYYPVL